MYMITVDLNKCDGCETCVNVCPSKVFILASGKASPENSSECQYCQTCIESCPNQSITINEI